MRILSHGEDYPGGEVCGAAGLRVVGAVVIAARMGAVFGWSKSVVVEQRVELAQVEEGSNRSNGDY